MARKVNIGLKFLLSTVLIVVVGCGIFVCGMWYANNLIREQVASHPLLAKRIFIENANDVLLNFEPLRSKLRDELAGYGTEVSLYFEYLPTGTSIRIGDTTQLTGASLVKLPYVMYLFRLAEEGKVDLDATIELKQEWLDDQFGELYKQGAGYKLNLRKAAELALRESDNTAINAIKATVSSYDLLPEDSSFQALDVPYTTQDNTVQLSARAYSSFLKCLYFSCYLVKDHSQELLNYLSYAEIGQDRMPKYLPADVVVAHKIGVTGQTTQGDCGIVYMPNRNYTLCILIKESRAKGSEAIAQLSKLVYDYVGSQP